MSSAYLPGAEPWSHDGGPLGVLVLHGFTGSPGSVRPVAEALAGAGFTVEVPCLPGHGTVVDDLVPLGWDDWYPACEAALSDLVGRCDRVGVVGQSMGATLACALASHHPEAVAAVVAVNPFVAPIDSALVVMVDDMLAAGETLAPALGADIADPDAHEPAYDVSPLAPLRSLFSAVEALQPELAGVVCPVLIANSPQDHVVEPANSEHLAQAVSAPVERLTLPNSFHVAALDLDRRLLSETVIDFLGRRLG